MQQGPLPDMLPGSGTILCGLAPSMEMLIVARAIAGMGGGGCVIIKR
jgi:MFS family permease